MNIPPSANPTPVPDPMTLPALQGYVREMVAERGFTTERNEVFILMAEEVGELATEFKNRQYYPERYSPQNLAHEIIDVLLYLLDLANGFEQHLMELWPGHEAANDQRFADRRKGAPPGTPVHPDMTLNQLAAHAEARGLERNFHDSDETLLMLLTEEVGEIATEIRKGWRNKGDPLHAGHEIIDALNYLFRLGVRAKMDFEQALRDKEQQNAQRSWSY